MIFKKKLLSLALCATTLVSSSATVITYAEASAQDVTIYGMTTDDLVNPIGIDSERPSFSWKMKSDTIGQKQTAYQITVKKDGSTAWDSGKVESDISVGIEYDGKTLESSTKYDWSVKVWDKDGKTTDSETAYFETGLLESNAWNDAIWISYKEPTLKEASTMGDALIPSGTVSETAADSVPDSWNFDAYSKIVSADPDGDGNFQNMLSLSNVSSANSGKAEVSIPLSSATFAAEITVAVDHTKNLPGKLFFGLNKDNEAAYLSLSLPKRTDSEHGDKAGTLFVYNGSSKTYSDDKVQFDSNNRYTELTLSVYCINGELEAYYNGKLVETVTLKSSLVPSGSCNLYLSVDWSTVYIKDITVNSLTDFKTDNDDDLPAYRKAVTVDSTKTLKSAKLYTSALGVYETYINGARVGNLDSNGTVIYDELKPGFTEPSGRKFYSTYDVTHMLTAGENVISSVVSSGWYNGVVVTTQAYGKHNAYLAKLILTYEDGTTETVNTDTTWKSEKVSPVRKTTGIFEGETYNAAADLSYMKPGFNDSEWKNVKKNSEFSGTITAWKGSPIRVRDDLERSAQSLKKYTSSDITGAKDGYFGTIAYKTENVFDSVPTSGIVINKGEKLIVDFGQNGAGWEYFELTATAGTTVTVRHSEALCESNGSKSRGNCTYEGGLYVNSNREAKATTTYIANGNGKESYHPTHTFYGFRYIEISATDTITLYSVSAQTVTSVEQDIGYITTSDEDVNKLINNVRRSMYSNFLSVPTDCPQRNERQGWTGDIQIFSQTANYLGFSKSFLTKFMNDMRDAMETKNVTSAFPSMAPNGIYGNSFGSTGWADAGIIIPYNVYSMYGDTTIIEENWDLMSNYLDKYLGQLDFDNLTWNQRRSLLAYCGHLSLEMNADIWTDAGIFADEEEKIQTCIAFYALDAKLMAQMAKVLGKEDDAEKYEKVYEQQKAYYIKKFVNSDGTIKAETQQSCLFALYTELLPDQESVDAVVNQLVDNIVSKGLKLQTGFLGTGILMSTLTKVGRSDVAYSLLLSHDYPSWLYAVDRGATTMWERWDTYVDENGWNQSGMNSLNHYAYGCVVGWLFEDSAGIGCDADIPGFKHIVFEPNPDSALNSVSASYESAYGEIKSAYAYSDGKLSYKITVPANATSDVKLPIDSKYVDTVLVNGKKASELKLATDGIEYTGYENGKMSFKTVSGSFSFTADSDETTALTEIKNTYDDNGVTYDCSRVCIIGDKEEIHKADNNILYNTYRTVNTNTDRLALHATVQQTTDSSGNATYAVKFPNVQGYTNGYPRAVQIYDSNDGNLSFFKTEKNVEYTISLKYRLDSFTSGHNVNLELRSGALGETFAYSSVISYGNITQTPITTTDEKGVWKTVSLKFKATESDYLHIVAVTDEYSANNWGSSNTKGLELWLDDIVLTYPRSEVVCHDYDGDSDKNVKIGDATCFAQLPKPTRCGFEFVGWYLDAGKTIPVSGDERASSASEVWAKWKAAALRSEVTMTFDESGLKYQVSEDSLSYGRNYINNKLTVGNSDWLSIRAGVISTDNGNAMSVQRVTSQKNAASSSFKLYDPKDFSLYTVQKGEKCTITFQYKLLQQLTTNGGTNWSKAFFRLRKHKSGTQYLYVESEQYADSDVITSSTSVGEWHTATLTFTATETTQLEIALVADYLGDTWGNIYGNDGDKLKANVDILVDNVVIRSNYAELENHIKGDMNDDKKVDVIDLIHLKKTLSGLYDRTTVSDLNVDGIVDAVDLTEIKKLLLGIR